MLSVARLHLPSEIPIVGCEITPYVLIRRSDGSSTTDEINESAPIDGCFLRFKWIRIQSEKKVPVCSIHPTETATLQCLGCLKAKIPVSKSYHCSPRCFSDAWQHHRVLHERAMNASNENGAEEDESQLFGRISSQSPGQNGPIPIPNPDRAPGESWYEISRSKTYTPTSDDIGHVLRFECSIHDAETKIPLGITYNLMTARVIPAPCPTPRRMISVGTVPDSTGTGAGSLNGNGTFTVLSYNVLAEHYATTEMYGYCPSWALSWTYRKQNLLKEIVGYHADIICLQEVQSNHFEEFFMPELDKHGYQALYKRRTTEYMNVFPGNPNLLDGCATFFRRDRFNHVKKYEVEFNKAAQSLTDAVITPNQKKAALSRLINDNIALIAVLEAKFGNNVTAPDNSGKRQLLCVANTHVNVQHDLKDVKLWQVHTLLKGLEKIAVSADIPMLVCGDLNSTPGSAPHTLMALGKLDQMHPDLNMDPLGILRPANKLNHQLCLVSAYSSFARGGGGGGGNNYELEQQRRRTDPATNEPLFTNCTRDFIATNDYIFYTADSLTVQSLLELVDEESLRKDTALPSPEWSSDHIALLAEFRCKPKLKH